MPWDDNLDEEGLPVKAGRGGGSGPGGGPAPGPGGGFGGGFGGGGFFGAERGLPAGEFFGVNTRFPRRKVLEGPNGPISMAFSPMQQDSVPAMLTPGEFVVNNRATQMPGAMDGLQRLNDAGNAQRFAEGGMVGMMDGMEGRAAPPDDRKELILKLLRLLLDDGEPVQGLAWGGQVRPQAGGFQRQAAAPAMAAAPGAASSASMGDLLGNSGMFGTRKNLRLGPGGRMETAPPMTGPTMGNDPNVLGSGDPMMQNIRKLLEAFQSQGAFGPEGNPALLESLRGEALGNADALRRRAAMNADVQGLDPGQRGAYAMQTDLNTQGDVGNILASAKRGQLESQQAFGQQMFGNMSAFDIQRLLAQLAAEQQAQLKRIH